jgi:hypothetical protein
MADAVINGALFAGALASASGFLYLSIRGLLWARQRGRRNVRLRSGGPGRGIRA